jgi:hypothetical protein
MGQATLTAMMLKNRTRIHGAMLPNTSRVASFMAYELFKSLSRFRESKTLR